MDRDSRLFCRFRATREPAALAQVFDRLAPDLLRIARHTCGNAADAEDVVQATFVAAIERADAWDERFGLFPWLVGILVRQAGTLRRARRVPDAERLVERIAEDPCRSAQGAEFEQSVTAALAQLDEPYRPVVHLHLRHGLNGKEIAEALGRPHARVRQQLVRGLQRLRALLPSALAMAAIGSATVGRGLAAVRQAVLSGLREGATASAGGTVLTIGGVLMWKKLLAVAAFVLFGMLLWWVAEPVHGTKPPVTAAAEVPVTTADLVGVAHGPDATTANAGQRLAVEAPVGSLRIHSAFGVVQREVSRRAAGIAYDRRMVGLAVELWRGEPDARPRSGTMIVRTGDDGEVVVGDLEPGWWTCDMVGPRPGMRVLIEAGREASIDLPLNIDGFARGRVVDPDGMPIADARILVSRPMRYLEYFALRQHDEQPPDLMQRCAGRSDGDGRFHVFTVDGELSVSAAAPGYAPSQPQPTWAASAPEVTLVLGRGDAKVAGTVLDAAGVPVRSALVCLHAGRSDHRWRSDGSLLLSRLPWLTRTNDGGAFVFESVPADAYQLRAANADLLVAFEALEVAAGSRIHVALRLGVSLTIRGRVVGNRGVAMRGLTVGARMGPGRTGYARTATTGRDGAFELVLAPGGSVQVVAQAGGQVLAERTFEHTRAGVVECDFTIADGGVLRGRLVDADGRGLDSWRIGATDARGDAVGSLAVPVTYGEGSFELLRWRPVACTLRACSPEAVWGDPDATLDVDPATSEVVFQVPADRIGSVRGRLRTATGEPLAVADLFLIGPTGRNLRQTIATAADGAFAFDHVPPAVFELRYDVPGGSCRVPFTLGRGQQLDLGDVVGEPLARFRIEFESGDGSPWRGALPDVTVRGADGEPVANAHWQVRDAGWQGQLAAGAYTFAIDAGDLIAAPQKVPLRAGERTDVRFAMTVGSQRELVFGGEGDIPIDTASIHIEVTDDSGRLVTTRSFRRSPHGDGTWTLYHAFPFGKYAVAAHTDTGLHFAGSFDVAEEAAVDRRVLVPRAR